MDQCAAELWAATRFDQATYCEDEAVPGSNYCNRHCEPPEDTDEPLPYE